MMYLRYYLNENGDRQYTLSTIDPFGKPTLSAHPARFSPEDKYSRQRITIKKRFGLLLTQQPELVQIKSERITELRKKYEEFLEQDRKRRERNEYILGKLDKLRECTTMVHHKDKLNFIDNLYKLPVVLPAPVPVGTPCRTIHSMPLQTATVNSTGTSFLDKILKKFILIPKNLYNSNETNTLQEKLKVDDSERALVDNADWKMKYEILNQLKQNEKEEPVSEKVNNVIDLSVDKKQDLPEKDTLCPDITSPLQNPIEYESYFYPDKDQLKVYGQFTDPALYQGGDPYSETVNFDYPVPPIEDQNNEIEIRPSFKGFQNKEELPINIEPAFQEIDNDRKDFKKPTETIKSHEQIEYVDDDGLNPAFISYPKDDIGNPLGDIPKNTEDMQYPKEVINVEEFTPHSDITVKDGVNVNPEGYGMNKNHFEPLASEDPETTSVASRERAENQGTSKVHPVSQESHDTTNENFTANITRQPEDQIQSTTGSEHVECLDNNAVIMAGNEELVAQSDKVFYQEPTQSDKVFYQEPTAESRFHQQAQQAVEDVYEPNESYQQDSQYYYQGPHEVAETVEVNEHEETSSPYDPNYFQQYSNDYRQQDYPQQESEQTPQAYGTQEVGYDQNQGYEGQQTYSGEAYDSSAVYEPQQGYDEQQAQVYAQYKEGTYVQPQYQQEDSETVHHIEQQIRKEEGYPEDNNEQPTEQISTAEEQKVLNQQQSQE